ncbi:Uncharacterised protein [Mycobacterium tuberculosis]|nr:Uncharacterised protein [Mycobacterium tuberculosis]
MNRRKLWGTAAAVLLLLVMVACQTGGDGGSPSPTNSEPEKINGVSARDIPVIVTEAYYQKDGKTLKKFIVKEDHESVEAFWDLDKGPHGDRKGWRIDPAYRLTEYRGDPDLYYYLLEYPTSDSLEKERFKVVKGDDGWKTFDSYSKSSWEYETQDLEPRLIKGVHDQP